MVKLQPKPATDSLEMAGQRGTSDDVVPHWLGAGRTS
jgi:hypothetical protein